MNRIRIVPAALLLCWAGAVQGQNLLSNPGFENATPGTNWQLWKAPEAPDADAAITFPDTGAHEGTRYARIEVKVLPTENWHVQLQLPPDWVVDSGATYELKFWARSDSARSIHVGIQDGPDNNFTYRTGMDFSLTTEWMEHSLTYTSDRQGNGALRFNLYLGASLDTYGFDGFSLQKQAAVGIGAGSGNGVKGQAIRVRQESGNLVLSLGGGISEHWKAELFDLQGKSVAAATGRTGLPLTLVRPRDGGVYFIRAATPTRSWIRTVTLR